MKRGPNWSHGILIAMLGIVIGVIGIMQALMLPVPGLPNWTLAFVGLACIASGAILAHRASRTLDRSLPPNEKRIPSARVHRSARR